MEINRGIHIFAGVCGVGAAVIALVHGEEAWFACVTVVAAINFGFAAKS